MGTYNLAVITQKLHNSGVVLFTVRSLRDILGVEKNSSFFSLLFRLVQSGVLTKLERGKYALAGKNIPDFSLANFLYAPSYVSLESALNFYGILSQFPYEVTSITPKKPRRKVVSGKTFSYVHVKKSLFWGYEKKSGFLIAVPEKALLDQLYFAVKGLKSISLDEYDFSLINISKVERYLEKYPSTNQFNKLVSHLRQYYRK
jgi:predicted transcriptional regulator of viral defense system